MKSKKGLLLITIVIFSLFAFGSYLLSDKGKKKVISTTSAPKAIGPYSQAIKHGNMLFLSGQLGFNPMTNQLPITVEEQTKQAMENLKAVLDAAKMDFKDVVQTHIFLKDINDFQKVNEIYAKYFDGDLGIV